MAMRQREVIGVCVCVCVGNTLSWFGGYVVI